MEERPPFTLTDALRHHYRVALAVVALFVLAAVALALLLPKTYEATAEIYLDTARTATDFDAGIAAGDLLQHDYIILANNRATLLEACTKPGVTCRADDLLAPENTIGKRVTATIDRGTSTLAVTAKGATPADAAALANAVAQSVIDQDAAEVARLLQPALDDLDGQLTRLSGQIATEQQALTNSAPGSTAAAAHTARLGELQTEYTLVEARKLDLLGRRDRLTNVASISQPALPPDKPESPSLRLYVAAAAVAGLCVGFLATLVVARFDDRIVTPVDLANAASLPLSLVAAGTPGPLPVRVPFIHNDQPRPYSVALATLLARFPDAHRVMVVAASNRDHVDSVASRLGAEAARAGHRVAVLQADGDSGHGSGGPPLPGLQTIVVHGDGMGTAAALRDVINDEPREEPNDHLVLVSVPSPDTRPSTLMLKQAVKDAVLVATAGVTRYGEARRTANLLRQSGVEIVAGMLLPRESPA